MDNTWTIYRKNTDPDRNPVVAVRELEYHGEWMAEEYVTVTVKSPVPIDFHFGDCLTYRGEEFSISYDPNVIKKARRGSYGEGFTYDNIKLYTAAHGLQTMGFKDVVLFDNDLTYTMLASFSFFAASVEDLADRIQANLNRDNGSLWTVFTPNKARTYQRVDSHVPQTAWDEYYDGTEETGETDVNIQIDNQSCWEVMKLCYEKFGLAWYIRNHTIVIGGKAVKADHIFRYGKGLGLYEIERTSDENIELVTKVFTYGSENNLPLNYYANSGKQMTSPGSRVTATESGTTVYGLRTSLPYDTVMAATSGGKNVTLQYNGSTVMADCKPYTSNTMQYVQWRFTGSNAQAFYNALGTGIKVVYVISGANLNMWPAAAIVSPAGYDYPAALSINRLMLPGFPSMSLHDWVSAHHPELLVKYVFSTDKNDPWIKSRNADTIGIFEGTVNFDGSQQTEICPTIEGATDGSGNRLDEVSWAQQMDDNGYLGEKPSGSILRFDMMPLGDPTAIDWNDHDTDVSINMKDGACVGRTFKMVKTAKNTNGDWTLTFEREQDTATGRYYPYKETGMAANLFQVMGRGNYQGTQEGDHFVITGINMQPSFIEAAAERLLIAACGWLDRRDHMRYTYLPKIDEIYMQRQDDAIKAGGASEVQWGTFSYHDTLRAGMLLEFEDTDLGIWRSPFIDVITIKENGNNGIPTYDVVLRDEKEKGSLEKIAEKISDLNSQITAPTERQNRPTRDRTYDKWEAGTAYYYQTLNPEPDPVTGVVYIETSYVWHNGKLWMCLRTLTTEEPAFGCHDWKCVSVGTTESFTLTFYNTTTQAPYPTYISTRRTNINIPITPKLFFGMENISSHVTSWKWTRYLINGAIDTGWNKTVGANGSIVLIASDMPTGWNMSNPAKFECTATFRDSGVDTEISAQVNI